MIYIQTDEEHQMESHTYIQTVKMCKQKPGYVKTASSNSLVSLFLCIFALQ